MKRSNFNFLIEQYVTGKTSKGQKAKIEAMLYAIKAKEMHWISDETEELLYQKIKDRKIHPKEITRFVNAFRVLRISDVAWMKFKGINVYFFKEAY